MKVYVSQYGGEDGPLWIGGPHREAGRDISMYCLTEAPARQVAEEQVQQVPRDTQLSELRRQTAVSYAVKSSRYIHANHEGGGNQCQGRHAITLGGGEVLKWSAPSESQNARAGGQLLPNDPLKYCSCLAQTYFFLWTSVTLASFHCVGHTLVSRESCKL